MSDPMNDDDALSLPPKPLADASRRLKRDLPAPTPPLRDQREKNSRRAKVGPKKSDRVTCVEFFSRLKWLDGRPLVDIIEPYRWRIFQDVLDKFRYGRPMFNMALCGRAKKNWKTTDLVLAALHALLANDSPSGNQCYILANDKDQAADDLVLAKKIIAANPVTLGERVIIKADRIERRDGKGFIEILPAGDVAGSHGKTYLFVGWDEIHGYRDWEIMEALQPDPTRTDSQQWITSYASIYHRPGVPLFDLMAIGKAGNDRRMYFSWYGADFTTDTKFTDLDPEARANPSMTGPKWDAGYLQQQRTRLPSHKFRRLHLNLPGLPEGSAFNAEMIMDAVDRGVRERPPEPGIVYYASLDMSGGSNDDSVLAIAHERDGLGILDLVTNQGQECPFDPNVAVLRFAALMKRYRITSVTGDSYAGKVFKRAFEAQGIEFITHELTKSELYEQLESPLNARLVRLLDAPKLEQEMLGLMWRGSKIDHPNGEHDDWANAVAGVMYKVLLAEPEGGFVTSYVKTWGPATEKSASGLEIPTASLAMSGAIHPHELREPEVRDHMSPSARARWRKAWAGR